METVYGKLITPGTNEIIGTGWLPPRPDLRDYTQYHNEIKHINRKLGISEKNSKGASSVCYHVITYLITWLWISGQFWEWNG